MIIRVEVCQLLHGDSSTGMVAGSVEFLSVIRLLIAWVL